MSVVEKLEETIQNFEMLWFNPEEHSLDECRLAFEKIQSEFVALEKACVIVPRKKEENKNYKAEAKASTICKKIIREGKRKDTRTAKQLGFWQGYLQRGKELLGVEKTK